MQNYNEKVYYLIKQLEKVNNTKLPKSKSGVDDSFKKDNFKQKKKEKLKVINSELKKMKTTFTKNEQEIKEIESKINNNDTVKCTLLKTIENEMNSRNYQATNKNNVEMMVELEAQKKMSIQLQDQIKTLQTEIEVNKKYNLHLKEQMAEYKLKNEKLTTDNKDKDENIKVLKGKLSELITKYKTNSNISQASINELKEKNQKLLKIIGDFKEKQKKVYFLNIE